MNKQQHILILAVFIAAFPFTHEWLELFSFNRSGIENWEIWRIWTSHWIHFSMQHWLLNGAGLLCYFLLFPAQIKIREFLLLCFFSATNISIVIWLFSDLDVYAGFSGVLVGLYVYSGLYALRHGQRLLGSVVLVLMSVKLGIEILDPSSTELTKEFIGVSVFSLAHQIGAISAIVFHLIFSFLLSGKVGIKP